MHLFLSGLESAALIWRGSIRYLGALVIILSGILDSVGVCPSVLTLFCRAIFSAAGWRCGLDVCYACDWRAFLGERRSAPATVRGLFLALCAPRDGDEDFGRLANMEALMSLPDNAIGLGMGRASGGIGAAAAAGLARRIAASVSRRLRRVDWALLVSDGIVGVAVMWALALAMCACWLAVA